MTFITAVDVVNTSVINATFLHFAALIMISSTGMVIGRERLGG